jgi:hypothetical protein
MLAKGDSRNQRKNLECNPTICQLGSASRVDAAVSSRGLVWLGRRDPFGDKKPQAVRRVAAGIHRRYDPAMQVGILMAGFPLAWPLGLIRTFFVRFPSGYPP